MTWASRCAFGSRGSRPCYVTMELETWRRAALPVVGGRFGRSPKGGRNRNDGHRNLRQDEDCRGRPDKLPGMTDRLAQRTFGRIIVDRKVIGRGNALVRFRLGRGRTKIGINRRSGRGQLKDVDVSLGDKAL